MSALALYCCLCYVFAIGAVIGSKHMPWFMFLIVPISVPVSMSYIYAKKLNEAFGDD